MNRFILLASCFISLSLFAQTKPVYPVSENAAKQLVAKVLKASPVIDGHNDLLVHYFDCKTCPKDLHEYRIDTIAKGHTDIPKMRKGGVGALLFNVFGKDTGFHAYMHGWDLLYRMEEKHAKDLKIVGSSAEMKKTMAEGKIALLPILEGAVRLKNDPALLRAYYKLGLRRLKK